MKSIKILFIALYSEKYPSIGESHGLSVVAGSVFDKCSDLPIDYFEVIDMVASSDNNETHIIRKIEQSKPSAIGFSVGYGTYTILEIIFDKLKNYIDDVDPLIFLGGSTATYIPEIILKNVYKKAVITIGEGDETTPKLIRSWYHNKTFENIPNLCFTKDERIHYTLKKLVSVKNVCLPYRGHIETVFNNKAQIYVESSRGCSWAKCSFCLRGLSDCKGKGSEYRKISFESLQSDILILKKHNIQVFTFADEDFLGGDKKSNTFLINNLEKLCLQHSLKLSFDASLSVNSIFSYKHTINERQTITYQLKKLRKIGLRKIFLGIESGSNSQLKRFGKEHSSKEALLAIDIIENIGFDLELGFIMLDPLCSIREIEDNLDYLHTNNLIKYVSSLGSELRLQPQTKYLKALEIQEKLKNKTFYERNLNFNTLSFPYKYSESQVSVLARLIKFWNNRIKNIHYPLKNLSRYGEGGILGIYRDEIFNIIINLRNDYYVLLKKTINELKFDDKGINNTKYIDEILYHSAKTLITLADKLPTEIIENVIFANVLKTCINEIKYYNSNYPKSKSRARTCLGSAFDY